MLKNKQIITIISILAISAICLHHGSASTSEQVQPESFRLMTYNIKGGTHNGNIRAENRKDSLYSIIKSLSPDIVCLQECNSYSIKGLDEIMSKDYPHIAHSFAMYSKYKVLDSFTMEPDSSANNYRRLKSNKPELFKNSIGTGILHIADIDIRGNIVRVISVRLASNSISGLNESSRIKKTIRSYQNYCYGRRLRNIQVKTIQQAIKESPYPTVLCGDMNDFAVSSTLEGLSRLKCKDVWKQCGKGDGATYTDKGLSIRIDHVYCTREIVPIQSEVISTKFSDHRPLVVDLGL